MPEAGGTAHIVVLLDSGERSVEIRDELTLGRSPQGELAFDEPRASRCHAQIRRTDSGRYEVEDLRSLNGTFVNGIRIAGPRELFHGDEILIGATRIRFVAPELLREAALPSDPLTPRPSPERTRDAAPPEPPAVALVCCVRNFSSLAEKLPSTPLAEFVRLWHEVAAQQICGCGGRSEPWAGDGVVAGRWLDVEQPDAAVQAALRAALQLVHHAAEFDARFRESFEAGFFDIGIGLHLCLDASAESRVEREQLLETAGTLADLSRDKGSCVLLSGAVAREAESGWTLREVARKELPAGVPAEVLALEIEP